MGGCANHVWVAFAALAFQSQALTGTFSLLMNCSDHLPNSSIQDDFLVCWAELAKANLEAPVAASLLGPGGVELQGGSLGLLQTSAPEVVILILTTSTDFYRQRVSVAMKTWVDGISVGDVLFYGGDAGEDEFNKHGRRILHARTSCVQDRSKGLCCKLSSGYREVLRLWPTVEFIFRGVDDSFIFDSGLRHRLEELVARRTRGELNLYGGQPCVCQDWFELCPPLSVRTHVPHAGGGGGWIASRPLVDKFLLHQKAWEGFCHNDDMDFGVFTLRWLGTPLIGLSGVIQEPRVDYLVESNETCQGPEQVSADVRHGDWGALVPAQRLPVSHMAMVHSNPEIWPQLARLQEQSLTEGGLAMQLDTPLSNMGPHFNHLRRWRVCRA